MEGTVQTILLAQEFDFLGIDGLAIVLPVLFALPAMATATTIREALGIVFYTNQPS